MQRIYSGMILLLVTFGSANAALLSRLGTNDWRLPNIIDTSPFSHLQPDFYWSGTTYAPNPGNAWNFNFNNGSQNNNNKTNGLYAWAVRPGG